MLRQPWGHDPHLNLCESEMCDPTDEKPQENEAQASGSAGNKLDPTLNLGGIHLICHGECQSAFCIKI
jgi:hypothetical protein